MTWAVAAEHDREPPRATVDMDVVVDVRARPGMTEWLATWLKVREFQLGQDAPRTATCAPASEPCRYSSRHETSGSQPDATSRASLLANTITRVVTAIQW